MKKFIALLLVVLLLVPTALSLAEDTKVIKIYCWNDEFQTRFEAFYEVPAGYTVEFVITPNQDNAYQNALDEALLSGSQVDIFLVEADYALKYCDSAYSLDVYADVGLTAEDTANMYGYTKDIMTVDGALKGVSWQACPAGFIYRRDYAIEVLGTDDPAEVQALIADWAKFDDVAAKMKAAGYFMVSGYDDAYRVFADNMSGPWVVDGVIQKDAAIEQWIAQTKEYTDLGYNNKANVWSAESGAGARKDGKVFGYFGPGWFIDFCLAGWTLEDADAPAELGNGSWGEWAFCAGPQGFSWGGTWICASSSSQNLDIVKDIMLKMTCDKDVLVGIAQTYNDFTNHVAAMEEIAASDFGSAFLGGQNFVSMMLDNAQKIERAAISPYDQTCTEKLQANMADYFNGIVDLDTAWANYFMAVTEIHPELSY